MMNRARRRNKNTDNEFRNLYFSPVITNRLIKSRRMRLVGHAARMGEMRNTYKNFVGNLKVTDHLRDYGCFGG
jgi:hypothetical protein